MITELKRPLLPIPGLSIEALEQLQRLERAWLYEEGAERFLLRQPTKPEMQLLILQLSSRNKADPSQGAREAEAIFYGLCKACVFWPEIAPRLEADRGLIHRLASELVQLGGLKKPTPPKEKQP